MPRARAGGRGIDGPGPSPSGQPRCDDRLLWDIVMGIYGYQAVLLAHELKLFDALAGGPRTLEEVAVALGVEPRPAETLLTVCASLGLVRTEGGRHALTPVSEDYLLEGSATSFGGFLDLTLANRTVLSFDSLRQAVLTNASQIYGGAELYAAHEGKSALAAAFTRMMHSHSVAPAQAWPGVIDLAGCREMLDIGGGSGAHAIAAALRWPELRVTILDLPPVCRVAEGYVARQDLAERVRTRAFDLWTDPYPPADLHFYSDIYHDFSPEKCVHLTQKSFESLEPGGRIVLHEMLLDDRKTGPFTVAGYGVSMLLWTQGQQFSGADLTAMLAGAGFEEAAVIPTFGYWNLVVARKP